MKTIHIRHTKFQSGMTLIEASVWFVMFALVIAGAMKLYSSVVTSQTVAVITADVMLIRSSTQQIENASGSYGTPGADLIPSLVNANKIPSSIQVTAGTPYVLTNEQRGTITVFANGPIASGDSFVITEYGLSVDVCVGLASAMALQNFSTIVINSVTFTPGSSISPTSASAACVSPKQYIAFTSN